MSNLTSIEEWFSERPVWLQDAARRIIDKGILTSSDYEELAALCMKTAELPIPEHEGLVAQCILPGTLDKEEEQSSQIKLVQISDVKGINRLLPRKPLSLGEAPLTIIYGRNGSGKSGYVRALKHAVGAKQIGKLHENVFTNEEQSQSCKFTYSCEGEVKEREWSPAEGIIDSLKKIQIFDSGCGAIYVNEENDLTFEPWILSFFSLLTEACSEVGRIVSSRKSTLSSKLPAIPQELRETTGAKWVELLSHNTTLVEISKHCSWDDDLQKTLDEKKKRLAEPAPALKAKEARAKKQHLKALSEEMKEFQDRFSDEKCHYYIGLKSEYTQAKTATEEAAKKVFKDAKLDGIGSDTWKQLWQSARIYSEEIAYRDKTFPNISEGAVCVLCQQPLMQEARSRFISFEEFVKSDLEQKLAQAKDRLDEQKKEIDKLPDSEIIQLKASQSGITNDNDVKELSDFIALLTEKKNSLIVASKIEEIKDANKPELFNVFKKYEKVLDTEANSYEADAKNEKRDELKNEVLELSAKNFLHGNQDAIKEEVDRLKSLNQFDEALRLTDTRALSAKKSKLADEIITPAYQERLQNELKVLGCTDLLVALERTRTSKGQLFHRLILKNCEKNVPAAEVLSEGEFRIISIASFLADVTSQSVSTPFIFDDPISSLDQDFEEATVKRLVELAHTRQVIVFSHRLSMLTMIKDQAKDQKVDCSAKFLEKRVWGTGEPEDEPIDTMKPKNALNKLKNERLPIARKEYEQGSMEEYEDRAKSICSKFRIILERIVEKEMLNEIVLRFRRSVTTDNRIKTLAIITPDDCRLIDEMMSKYSCYEHSQPYETPIALPNPDEFEQDIDAMANWLKDFDKRKKSA